MAAPDPHCPASAPIDRVRRLLADLCHVMLSSALWLGGTLLAALGSILAIAILAADARMPLFFAHLDNLATRYLAADPARRAAFDLQLIGLSAALALLLILARLPAFVARLRRELARGDGQ